MRRAVPDYALGVWPPLLMIAFVAAFAITALATGRDPAPVATAPPEDAAPVPTWSSTKFGSAAPLPPLRRERRVVSTELATPTPAPPSPSPTPEAAFSPSPEPSAAPPLATPAPPPRTVAPAPPPPAPAPTPAPAPAPAPTFDSSGDFDSSG